MNEHKWDNTFLDNMRHTGDPEADKIAEILWKDRDRPIMEDLKAISKNHHLSLRENIRLLPVQGLLSNDEVIAIEKYFGETSFIEVTEEDKKNFEISSDIFNKYGYQCVVLLFFKALPTGYLCPKPGHVLASTKLLENFAARRVMETAQFVFAVNKKDWYAPGSRAIEAIQRVRLMHAGMRVALKKRGSSGVPWDVEKYGIPINQEDLALTNYLFSLGIIEGLDQLAIHLNDDERKAIFHTWQKIGQAMGIVPDMITSNYEDAWKQYKAILKRQSEVKNPDGPPLTHALLKAMDEITHIDVGMETLGNLTMYLLNDSRTPQSLGLHNPSILAKLLNSAIQTTLSQKIWQTNFNHERTGMIQSIFTKITDKVFVKMFHLQSYMAKYPGISPLEAFSKVMMNQLGKRDRNTFSTTTSSEELKKEFLIDDELYVAWGLGGFDMEVGSKTGK